MAPQIARCSALYYFWSALCFRVAQPFCLAQLKLSAKSNDLISSFSAYLFLLLAVVDNNFTLLLTSGVLAAFSCEACCWYCHNSAANCRLVSVPAADIKVHRSCNCAASFFVATAASLAAAAAASFFVAAAASLASCKTDKIHKRKSQNTPDTFSMFLWTVIATGISPYF